jgi:guanyl-specific ribonuclease Sa
LITRSPIHGAYFNHSGFSPFSPIVRVLQLCAAQDLPCGVNKMRAKAMRFSGWPRTGLILILLGILAYRAWQERPTPVNAPQQFPPASTSETPAVEKIRDTQTTAERDDFSTTLSNQTIRDQQGEVAYRGDIELAATIARIRRQERLDFPNDGTVFQNRERRLPRKPPGYYHEFVHPTAGMSGPGPQRIVTGEGGELYYTPDHYRTFQRLENP